MLINAVSTLEIDVAQGSKDDVKHCLSQFTACFDKTDHCLSYTITPGTEPRGLWILVAYWSSPETMISEFDGEELSALVWALGKLALSIRFSNSPSVLGD
jgi:quinol monooxygenase YgiN